MSGLFFAPLDQFARDGALRLVRDVQGHQHSARWSKRGWVYSSGQRLGREITEYCVRGER